MKLEQLHEAKHHALTILEPVEQVIDWLDSSEKDIGPFEPNIHEYPIMDIYHSLVAAFGPPDDKSENMAGQGDKRAYVWHDRGRAGSYRRDVQLLIWPGLHRLAAYRK